VAWLGHRGAHRAWAALTLLGLLLVLQQWDAFLGTAPEFFTPGGLLLMAAALSATKVLHELGHAYTATAFGCRVSSMGVHLMLGVPMLYTDTSSAWRLAARAQRLWIDAAGVLVETGVAGLATLAWTLLPEGALRSVAFALATSTWLLTLAVNLNPFARFDGYYFLSDWLGMPNLQPRAFALAQWWIEHTLLGHRAAPPEVVSGRRLAGLVTFAALTWLYRITLGLGVALLVYHLFFKALGVALLVLEVWMLLLKPVVRWVQQGLPRGLWRGTAARWRLLIGGALLLALLGLPLDRHVEAPAVLAPTQHTPMHVHEPARIEQVLVHDGQQVEAGALLVRLSVPDLAVDDTRARITQLLQGERLDRGVADATDRGQRTVFEEQWQESAATLQALAERRAALELRAQHAGTVTDLDATLRPGRWVAPEQQLARIVDTRHGSVQGFVPQSDAWRLSRNAAARSLADDPARPRPPASTSTCACSPPRTAGRSAPAATPSHVPCRWWHSGVWAWS
jgi:putative peptide zinc metalloprotease protein